ncbi:uncharacterized protein LOC122257116 [Penaeus japonicus]|uniref:uncharacterized protein LOC122257116 n=1 Tax=Penaeus japonicus TaxID=27405 RepID=UPI001C712D3F|nr:uncharacterized protein LOC122257116 [Penaeus japonicus]
MKALILLVAVATASALPSYYLRDASCQGAENVTLCEADLQVCRSLFTADTDEEVRRNISKSCLDQNGFSDLEDVDPEVLFSPTESEALSLFGSEEKHQAVRECVLGVSLGVLGPDGTLNPQPFVETATLALNDTRPDILERITAASESCPIENIAEWETCVLSACFQWDTAAPVPTTIAP